MGSSRSPFLAGRRDCLFDRLNRLTDAYIDRLIEKDLFEQRKSALIVERTDLEQRLAEWKSGKRNPADELQSFLERADGAYLAYKVGLREEKRDLLDSLTSNRLVSGKIPEILLALPFNEVANRSECTNGGTGIPYASVTVTTVPLSGFVTVVVRLGTS